MNINGLLNEWSFRCKDGIVNINDPDKVKILQEIFNEKNISIDILKEIKGINIKKDQTFILSNDMGEFKKGNKVKVLNTIHYDDEVEIELENEEGIKDIFTIDKEDSFDELNESFLEEE